MNDLLRCGAFSVAIGRPSDMDKLAASGQHVADDPTRSYAVGIVAADSLRESYFGDAGFLI
jgi:hypothetical protein